MYKKMKEWMNRYASVILPSFIYIMLFSFFILFSLEFDLSSIINGGDTAAILDPNISFQKGLYLWENSVFGRVNIQAFNQMIYATPLLIAYQFFPISIAHIIYWVLLFSSIPIFAYLLSNHLFKNSMISFFIGLFYSLNLFTAIIQHTPVYHIVYLQAITPLLVLILLRIFEKKRIFVWESLMFALLFLPLFRMLNIVLMYIFLIPIIVFLLYALSHQIKGRIKNMVKKTMTIFILIALLSVPYGITLYTSQSSEITQADPNIEFSRNSVKSSKVHAKLINIIRFTTSFGWEKENFWEEIPGIQSFNAARTYHENPFFIMMTFYPIIIGLFLLLYVMFGGNRKRKLVAISLLGLSLLLIFLGKMINPPLGGINLHLYDTSSLFLTFFRSAWKYVQIPYLFLLSLIIGLGLTNLFSKRKFSKRKQILLIGVIIILQVIYVTPAFITDSSLIHEDWSVTIPKEYYDLADFINDQPEVFRILPLPLSQHITGYTPYTWGYVGPDVLYSLLNKPMIDKYNNPVLSEKQLQMVDHIEELTHSDLNRLLTEIKTLNVKYILLRNDVDTSHRFIKPWSDPSVLAKSLDQVPLIQSVKYFGNITLYELDYAPRFYKVEFYQQDSSFISIDNQTNIHISNPTTFDEVDQISLNLSFYLTNKSVENNSDWKQTNQRLIKTNLFQITVTPKGFLHLFLYRFNESFESLKIKLDKSDLIEKKVDLQLFVYNNKITLVKDGFIYSSNFIGQLRSEVKFIQIGGEENVEKMIGNLYDFSLSVNNVILYTFDDLLDAYPHIIKYQEDEEIGSIQKTGLLKDFSLIQRIKVNDENITIDKISNTKYQVLINADDPFLLAYMSNYDPNWQAVIYKNGQQIDIKTATPFLSVLNGFWINETGLLQIEITYLPQNLFETGLIITILTLLGCVGYLILNWKIPWLWTTIKDKVWTSIMKKN